MSKFWVLVGSFSPFITTLQFTASPPSLSFVSQAVSGTRPSWVAQSPKFPTTIYATDAIEAGAINSLALDLSTGKLTQLANISTQGNSPNHLGFINQGAAIGASNFGNGSAFIVNLDTTNTGQFTGTGAKVAFHGSGPNPMSQTGPHAHQVSRNLIRRPRLPD
jgi:6-phosphogluconolactonase (cycloisomerase 2 family)